MTPADFLVVSPHGRAWMGLEPDMIDRSHMWQILAGAQITRCYQPRPIVKVDRWGTVLAEWRSMGDCCDAEGFSIKVLRIRLEKVAKYLTQNGVAYYHRDKWEAQGRRHCLNGQFLLG